MNEQSEKTKLFIEKARKIHGNKYDYSLVEYINNSTKISITCKEHGLFEQQPNNHLMGKKCKKCSIENIKIKLRSNTKEFIEKSITIYGDKYDYSKVEYIDNSTKIIIICKEHREFEQKPADHLSGNGCQICGKISSRLTQTSNITEFIEKSITIHGDKYDYSKVEYIKAIIKVIIVCKTHGEFDQTPNNHLNGNGCPKCVCNNYSKSSIKYLNFMEKYNNIQIQHAENVGEHIIKTTNYSADGYCEETNTIYEFHGDFWHGNPKIYDQISINKRTGKTFGELYQKTLKREQQIKDLGYNLVVIWEHDWNKINQSIRTLQRIFKSLH